MIPQALNRLSHKRSVRLWFSAGEDFRHGAALCYGIPYRDGVSLFECIGTGFPVRVGMWLGFFGRPRSLHWKRSTAEMMKELARMIMPGRRVLSESNCWRTAEHPKNVGPFVGTDPFILVTSATHMKRAVQSFERNGLKPIPYPVDFLIRGEYSWTDFLPSIDSLWKLNVAFREYLALALYAVKRW